MSSASDEARRRWKAAMDKPGNDGSKVWNKAKSENEKIHIHFEASCNACGQVFSICGLPCFVICPNCHLILRMGFVE